MKTKRVIISGISLILLLSLVGFIGLVTYLDRNKALVEATASQALGRDVRIEDGITLSWSMKPTISLHGLRVGNPAWASGEYFARAQRAYLQLDIASLLHGHLGIAEVMLQNADVVLETSAKGARNWDFGSETSTGTGMSIDRLVVENSRLSMRPAVGEAHRLSITDLELRGLGSDDLSMTAKLNYRDLPIELSASTDPHGAAAPTARLFKGELSSGEMTADFSGRLKDGAVDLTVTLQGDRLDLPESLRAVLPDTLDIGPLHRISGQFKTAGAAAESLLSNLKGKLNIGALGLTLPEKHDGVSDTIDFTETAFELVPGKPLSMHSSVHYRKHAFQLDMSGASLAGMLSDDRIWKNLGLKVRGQIGSAPFVFAARLQVNDRDLGFKDIVATIAGNNVTGEIRLPFAEGGKIEARLEAETLNITPFSIVAESDPGSGESSDALLNWELPSGSLPRRDAVVQLNVAHLHLGKTRYDGLKLNAALERGRLGLTLVDQVKKLNIRVGLEPQDSVWRLTLSNRSELDFGMLADGNGTAGAHSQGTASVDVHLTGSGKSLASAIGSAQGRLNTVVGAGELTEDISRHLPMGSVVMTLLHTLGGEDKVKSYSQFECAVLYLDVADGIGRSINGLALRTDHVNLLGAGTLNLTNGEIDLQFKAAQRKGFGISILGLADNFIRLTGTLAQPRVDVNVRGVITHGGAAWATGGLSLVFQSLLKRLTAFSNPCETVLNASVK